VKIETDEGEQAGEVEVEVGGISYRLRLSATTRSGFLHVEYNGMRRGGGVRRKPWAVRLSGHHLGYFSDQMDAAVCVAKFQTEGVEAARAWHDAFGKQPVFYEERTLALVYNGVPLHTAQQNASGYRCVIHHPNDSHGNKRPCPFRHVERQFRPLIGNLLECAQSWRGQAVYKPHLIFLLTCPYRISARITQFVYAASGLNM
jgi:hypothetical protein